MREVVIASVQRTPVGTFLGSLSAVPARDLGATAIKAAVEKAGVPAEQLELCIMGNVLQAGQGQAPCRQASLAAGIPQSVPCMTINKVCGSGLKAIQLVANEIALGNIDAGIGGGMENMSLVPYALPSARTGYRMSMPKGDIVDLMVFDGLWNPYDQQHMGNFADLCAREKGFKREELDEFGALSFRRALNSIEKGLFKDEIVPVKVPGRKGEFTLVDTDENPAKVNFDKIPTLKPVFNKDGMTTAANASSINDGAAAAVLLSSEKAAELGVKPLARIISYAEAAHEPEWFTTAPVEACRKALAKAGLTASDIDLFEINEAFAVVTLFAVRELGLSIEKVNVNGGAIAIGHPIGASGARLMATALNAMQQRNAKRALVSLCIGGGEANAMIIERI
mgnify:CR=1 FL=1